MPLQPANSAPRQYPLKRATQHHKYADPAIDPCPRSTQKTEHPSVSPFLRVNPFPPPTPSPLAPPPLAPPPLARPPLARPPLAPFPRVGRTPSTPPPRPRSSTGPTPAAC